MSEQEGATPQITITRAPEGRLTDHDIKGLETWKARSDIAKEHPVSWPPKKNPFTSILHLLTDIHPGGLEGHAVNNIYHGMSSELQHDTSIQPFLSLFFNSDMQSLFSTPLMMNEFNWKVAGGANNSWGLPLDKAANYYYDQITESESSPLASINAYLRVLMMKGLITSGWRHGKEMNQAQTQIEADIQKQIDRLLENQSIQGKLGENIVGLIQKLRDNIHGWAAVQSEVLTYCEKKRPSYFGRSEPNAAAAQMMGESITSDPMASQGTLDGPPDWTSIFKKTQADNKKLPQVTIT